MTIPDAVNWPDGSVVRERKDPDDKSYAHSKWAWRSQGYYTHNGAKAERRGCLGVYRCGLCRYLVRPHTQVGGRERQLSGSCPNRRCPGVSSLEELNCDAHAWFYSISKDGGSVAVWEHCGHHRHPRPPGGRISPPEQEALDQQVVRRPEASVHQLRTGDAAPGSVPLAQINPRLADPRSARYEVSKSQTRLGLQPAATAKGGLAVLHDLGALTSKHGVRFIVESSFSGPTYFVLQTPFMVSIIEESVRDWVLQDMSGPDAGRHGFVTDGDQSFFRQGTLLATCAFSTTLAQWVPVLYSWVDGLDTDHHRPHFRRLNQAILRAAGTDFEAKYLTAVSHLVICL